MLGSRSKSIIAWFFVVVSFLLSLVVVARYSGLPASKHVGGIVNIGLSLGFIHLISLVDPRWGIYEEIIEQNNKAFAICYAGCVVGACIAAPSSIL